MSSRNDRIYKTTEKNVLVVDNDIVIETPNPTYTQNYGVFSFIFPEDEVKQRFFLEANEFLCQDVNVKILNMGEHVIKFINTECSKLFEKYIETYKKSNDEQLKLLGESLQSIKSELRLNEDELLQKSMRQYKLDYDELLENFNMFKINNSKQLAEKYKNKYGIGTSIRGFKFRGGYQTEDEARSRAKYCTNNIEPNIHSFIVEAGKWAPLDPSADAVQDQEHMIDELNTLMTKYNENAAQRNEHFEERMSEMINEKEKSSKLKQSIKEKILKEKLNRTHKQ